MIRNFRCQDTERLFARVPSRRLPTDVQRTALKRLRLLDSVEALDELRSPPGNRLEALRGDREGQWSIRINDQWRVCFKWVDGAAHDVEIVDYH